MHAQDSSGGELQTNYSTTTKIESSYTRSGDKGGTETPEQYCALATTS